MAKITLTADYESPLDPDLEAWQVENSFKSLNDAAARLSGRREVEGHFVFRIHSPAEEGRLRWSVSQEFDIEILQPWDGDRASRSIATATERFEKVAEAAISHSLVPVVFLGLGKPMREALRAEAPIEASAIVPLRHGDPAETAANPMALVRAALEKPNPFAVDLARQLDGMSVAIKGSSLMISGHSLGAVGLAAAAFVRVPRPIVLPKAKQPYWAYASIAILVLSFALSWFPVSAGAIAALGVFTLVTAMTALHFARPGGVLGHTALGLVPVVSLIAFAIVYAIAALGGQTLSLHGGEQPYLRDALLLSLSLASTVGVLDLTVTGWLRSIAYLEMLLAAGSLGTAAVVAVRSVSVRLDQTLRELRRERGDG